MTRIDLKKLATAVTISGALGLFALGFCAGVATAAPVTPMTGPAPWSQDKGDHDWDGPGHDWHGPRGWRGPGPIGWPTGCVNATDPTGLVTGTLCV